MGASGVLGRLTAMTVIAPRRITSAVLAAMILLCGVLPVAAAESIALDSVFSQRMVQAQVKPGQSWTAYPTRTIDDLPDEYLLRGYVQSIYGGWLDKRVEGTGF